MTIELLHRRRFDVVDDAIATQVGPNAWQVRLPLRAKAVQRTRLPATEDAWDGTVLCLDGIETEPGTVSALSATHITLTVWTL